MKYMLNINSYVALIVLLFSAIKANAQSDSLDLKIGQMLLVGMNGQQVDDDLLSQVEKGNVGGVIFFEKNLTEDNSFINLKKATWKLQQAARQPLLIAIDQEGGKVNRLKEKYGFPRSVTAEYLGEVNSLDSTRFYAEITASTLSGLGFNVNFAPVVDLSINKNNPVIAKHGRSFGDNSDMVARHAAQVIDAHRKFNVVTVLKHFPGHGSSKEDSHLGVVDVSQTWKETELIPYREIIQKDLADMVMTAHIFNSRLDSVYPATLSGPTINGLLRDSLNFSGVVVSDDLQMKAIRTQYGLKEAIKLSIEAGVDILVFANNSIFDEQIVEKAHRIIKELVEKNEISKKRIDNSYNRIMNLKKEYITDKN